MTERAAGAVVVVGAINVDYVVTAPRLPGAGETVVGERIEYHGGGKGANAAVSAAGAGARVRLVGAVGTDDAGAGAVRDLRDRGVAAEHVAVLGDRNTGAALIVVDPGGENQIAVGAGANYGLTSEHVESALDEALPGAGCVLVSTEIPAESIAAAVRRATAAGIRCVLNPAPVVPELAELLPLGPVLTPNAGELAELCTATGADGADVAGRARALSGITGSDVVVTLGGDGCLLARAGGGEQHFPAPPTTVRDTTGAGDAFNGSLAARLAAGSDIAEAVERATAAASRSVAEIGARPRLADQG